MRFDHWKQLANSNMDFQTKTNVANAYCLASQQLYPVRHHYAVNQQKTVVAGTLSVSASRYVEHVSNLIRFHSYYIMPGMSAHYIHINSVDLLCGSNVNLFQQVSVF